MREALTCDAKPATTQLRVVSIVQKITHELLLDRHADGRWNAIVSVYRLRLPNGRAA